MAVVVAVDESAGSVEAIRLAATEAGWRGIPLVAVMAYRTDSAAVPAGRPLSTPRSGDEGRVFAESTVRAAVQTALGDNAAEVRMMTIAGPAGRGIMEAAREVEAELIVLAARPGISILPGSVSQHVLRNAMCPVLLVPSTLGSPTQDERLAEDSDGRR
jgi:nucleotide-binding universal stress UspA family protein